MKLKKCVIAVLPIFFFTTTWADQTCPNLEITAICKKGSWRFLLNENFPADWELEMTINYSPCPEGATSILKFSKAVYSIEEPRPQHLQCRYQALPIANYGDVGTVDVFSAKHIYDLEENNVLSNWLLPSDSAGAHCEGGNLSPVHCPIKLK